jgi:hypothetical protein
LLAAGAGNEERNGNGGVKEKPASLACRLALISSAELHGVIRVFHVLPRKSLWRNFWWTIGRCGG